MTKRDYAARREDRGGWGLGLPTFKDVPSELVSVERCYRKIDMDRRVSLFVALCGGLATGLPAFAEDDVERLAWIKEAAIPISTVAAESGFEDLQPIKELIGSARIVALGEATHGSREIFQMKHRLLEFLASEMDFDIFSIEASMPESYRVGDYVRSGKGNPSKLIGGMYFWTWNTQEVLEMVAWMRRFSQVDGQRLEFTGFDLQTPDVAKQIVLEFLQQQDKALHAAAKTAYENALNVERARGPGFGVVTGTFPSEDAKGKRVVYRGWIKTENITNGFAGLWMRADGPDGDVLAFDNMNSQNVSGTKDWAEYEIELNIPAETVNINFGMLMPGTGTAWFDGLAILLDDKPYGNHEMFDFDFEADALRGLAHMSAGTYHTSFDTKNVKIGKQSLRLESVANDKAVAQNQLSAKAAAKNCESILSQLKEARGQLITSADAKQVDWIIQNARVVAQCMNLRGGSGSFVRDKSMADNVAWILEQNADSKIVLWAHNGHIGRRRFTMGKYLHDRFGDDYVAIGFATGQGEYQAVGQRGLSVHPLQTPPDKSAEHIFAQADIPRFIVDLRDLPHDHWLAKPILMRSIGALAMDQQFHAQNPAMLFDALIYLDKTSAAVPLGGRR